MLVSREVTFSALHSHHGMMSEPVHPHNFTVRITMQGNPNEEGFVCDFRAVKRLFRRLVTSELEGRNLDDFFEYATSENLAVWIWQKLEPFFPLYSIEVREKPHSCAVYFGPQQTL
jgi:6-pyruvoyltetrahydropterin/6-carboxytetrahydropterin synthase